MKRESNQEIWNKNRVFDGFGNDDWFCYYRALNKEVPVDKIGEDPYRLNLTDAEKACYLNELDSLKEERKKYPWAAYGVESRYLDD